MTDELSNLLNAARQLVDAEVNLGGDFMPARRNPLPLARQQKQQAGDATGVPASPTIPARRPSAAPAPAAMSAFADNNPTYPPNRPEGAAMTRQQKIDALAELNATHVATCANCALCKTRTNTVFGEGDPEAKLMFVGEAPGADEDAAGRPFVGKAGQLLDKMIAGMGLRREQVYIANTVKCRPPGNRAPTPEEAAACWPCLVRQMQIIAPQAIVTMGNPATHGLLRTTIGITKLRGQWQKLPDIGEGLEGIPVMPTFHPSFVLRTYTPEVRGMVWSDLQKVMAFLGLKLPQKGTQ